MSRSCILHIGMPKTGTTHIQRAIHRYDDGAVMVPHLGGPNQSGHLINAFGSRTDIVARNMRLGAPNWLVRIWGTGTRRRIARALSGERVNFILTGEKLAGGFTADDVARLRDFLLKFVDAVRVLAYVRDPVGLIQSGLQQRIRRQAASLSPEKLAPRYRQKISPWLDEMGAGCVSLVAYRRANFPGGDVLADFCARTGIEPGRTKVPDWPNTSLSAEAFALLFTFRQLRPQADAGRSILANTTRARARLSGFGGRRMALGAPITGPVLERAAADIAWMEQAMGEPFLQDPPAENQLSFESAEEIAEFAFSVLPEFADCLGYRIDTSVSRPDALCQVFDRLYRPSILAGV